METVRVVSVYTWRQSYFWVLRTLEIRLEGDKFVSSLTASPILMELIVIESDAYAKLQKTNINLIRTIFEEERAQQPAFGWLSHKEAAKLLGACPRTMQSWRDSGVLGFSQVGKKIYHRYEDIDKMLQQHYRKPFRAVA